MAFVYPPHGTVPILLLFAVTAGLSILPRAAKQRVADAMFRHSRPTKIAYIVFVTAFETFGVARSVLYLVNPAA